MWFEKEGRVVVALPGVPYEMKHLIGAEVLPKIQQRFSLPFNEHRTLMTYGLGESAIAERLEDFENALPEDIKLAYLPSLGRVRLRISASGSVKEDLQARVEQQVTQLRALVSDIYYGEEEDGGIEAGIARLLTEKGLRLATAESFTGGQIARQLIGIPGASQFFKGSVVAYDTEIKRQVLEVPSTLIEQHSVVSEEVAVTMVRHVQQMMQSDFAIATTGNAGPTKGDSDEEVGEVYIAIASPEGAYAHSFQMGKNRERITQKSVNKALEMIYQEILKF
jgi:nicotinamide-nucleotide amidase